MTYIAPLQETTTQRGPSPVTTKEEGLQRYQYVKFGRVGRQQGTKLKGRSFHAEKGPSLLNS